MWPEGPGGLPLSYLLLPPVDAATAAPDMPTSAYPNHWYPAAHAQMPVYMPAPFRCLILVLPSTPIRRDGCN